MSSMDNRLDEAIAQLHQERDRIGTAGAQAAAVSCTVSSKDRMITATVDGQGRITELKLAGTRYRELAPADLCARIVETVGRAQQEATRQSLAAFMNLIPTSLGQALGGAVDLDAMVAAALETAADPLFPTTDSGSRGDSDGR